MQLTVRTRSSNEDLYIKMASLLPENLKKIRSDNYREWYHAASFLHDSIENTEGMLLIIDDDCFISNWDKVFELVCDCYNESVAYCGVPDFEIIPHRTNSWVVANPFFLILNCDIINAQKEGLSNSFIDSYDCHIDESEKPEFISLDCEHGDSEPFNGLFYWMHDIGLKYKPLKSAQIFEGVSTKVIYDGIPICYHSWYSREYAHFIEQKERIDNLFEYVKMTKA